MDYFVELYLVPGNYRGAVVFEGCSQQFMQNAKHMLKTEKGKIPAVCVSFGKKDQEIVEQFVSQLAKDDKNNQMIIARSYVNTKIFNELLKVIPEEKLNRPSFAQELKQKVSSGVEMFKNGQVEEFVNYYINTPLFDFVIDNIAKENRSWELDIFLKAIGNLALQRAINNHIDFRKSYNVKVFTNMDRFCTYLTENGVMLENVHDYSSQKPFEISAENLAEE